MDLALAVDVGGTKLEVGLVDAAGSVVSRSRRTTPAGPQADVWSELVAAIDDALAEAGRPDVAVVGVGCGGPMTAGGQTVSPLNIPAWRAFPLRDRLSEKLAAPVAIDNDAKALALGEGWLGAARGIDSYMAMVVSTGVGGGVVVDGRLLDGRDGNAGHVGHLVADPAGPRCACGAVGCLEAMVSGTAIAARYGVDPASAPAAVRSEVAGTFGATVAGATQMLALDLVVVAGSVALGWGDDFFGPARVAFSAGLGLEHAREARLEPAGLGADGPLIGAAAVGWRHLGSLR